MGTLQDKRVSLHIDPGQLRKLRLQKHWTQRDLARATGFCEDYISQLERAPTTRNKGTKVETLMRLAHHLDVLPADLLAQDAFQQREADILLHMIGSNFDTGSVFHSISSTAGEMEQPVVVCMSPAKLRAARLRKKWTQCDLAHASGYSEDYISQLERGTTTRNKGTWLETILRLAHVLEVAPVELLTENLSERLRTEMIRRELLGDIISLGLIGLLCRKMPSALPSTVLSSPVSLELPTEPLETVAALRDKAHSLSSRALWVQAEAVGLQARARCKEGGEEWAEITLNHCTQARQQAGDIPQANQYIEQVLQRYVNEVDHPDSRILALINMQRGWMASEQLGTFEQGYHSFTDALEKRIKVGDRESERTARHFRFRLLSELAMKEGGAWLGARPMRSINPYLLRLLQESLQIDWPLSCDNNPEQIHALNRRYMVYVLLQPDKALRETPKLISIANSVGAEHVVDLTLARWHFSNEAWDTTDALAHQAFQGYCRAAYPQGIAWASALRAEALFQNRLRTREDASLCLDLWLLILFLHPYESHPLWITARRSVSKTLHYIHLYYPAWLRPYYDEINERVERKEGVFQALQYIYINTNRGMPTHYLGPQQK